jgi:hypothetical protein
MITNAYRDFPPIGMTHEDAIRWERQQEWESLTEGRERYRDCRLANYHAETPEQRDAVEKVRQYILDLPSNVRKSRGILLHGPVGTGKIISHPQYSELHVSAACPWLGPVAPTFPMPGGRKDITSSDSVIQPMRASGVQTGRPSESRRGSTRRIAQRHQSSARSMPPARKTLSRCWGPQPPIVCCTVPW